MKNLVYISLVPMVIGACKKDKDATQSPLSSSCSIYYNNFDPDTIINMPAQEGSSYFFLDVNGDSITDARFTLYHGHELYGSQYHDVYRISVLGIDSLEFVSTPYPFDGPCNATLDTATYVGSNATFQQSFQFVYVSVAAMIGCNSFLQKGYVGLRLYQDGDIYYGWIHVQVPTHDKLIVDDLAMSNCANDSIKIGLH
jgi:hypothetical protein